MLARLHQRRQHYLITLLQLRKLWLSAARDPEPFKRLLDKHLLLVERIFHILERRDLFA
jgi:hypothetical protein